MKLLEVNKLSVAFNNGKEEVLAIDNVNFTLAKGEILGIVGESGSGKSVTSLAIMKLIEENNGIIKSGEILFKGRNLLTIKEKEMCSIRGQNISMIFQEPMTSLNPVMTIYKQINEVLKIHNKDIANSKSYIIDLLDSLNIPEPELILDKYPFELSGGMRQRIMIAMAVVCEPDIIIADEPTTALDVTTQAEILQLLKSITEKTGTSIILITHDLGVIAEIAEKVMVMYRGRVVEQCSVNEFFKAPVHPYSHGLLESMPDNFKGRFMSIQGNVPSINTKIEGCPFESRCSYCMEECKKNNPPLINITDKHRVACWLRKCENGGVALNGGE